MDIKIDTRQTTVGTAGDDGGAASERIPAAGTSVLSGAGVTVTETTDFERLLAKMEMERDERRQMISAQRFASALVLMGEQYDDLRDAKGEALGTFAENTLAYDKASQAEQAARAQYTAASAVLAVMTRQLEALVEAQRKTPEERAKEVGARLRLAEEQNEEQQEESQEIKDLREKIAAQQRVVDASEKALGAAVNNLEAAGAALSDSMMVMTSLNGVQAKSIAEIVRRLADEAMAAAAERTDGDDGTAEKANAVVAAMEEYVEAVEQMQKEKLDEIISKTSVDLQFLLRRERTLQPGELGGYNEIV